MSKNENLLMSEVYKSVTETMVDRVIEEVSESNNRLIMSNLEFTETAISNGVPLTAVSKLNADKFKDNIDSLTRANYKFPSFLNIGELKAWKSTPSKIIEDQVFSTSAPMFIPVESASVAVIQNQKYKESIATFLETGILKMFASIPTGLSRLLIIDKTGSGQNFPNLIQLHPKITGAKIVSEDLDIESELENIKSSMSAITGSITANGFSSIEDYNNNTDGISQPYQMIAISNFPVGFSKRAAESLLSILESGYKAGIYVFMSVSVNMRFGMNQPIAGLSLSDFLNKVICLEFSEKPHEYIRRDLIKNNVNILTMPTKNETDIKDLFNNNFKMILEEPKVEIFENIVSLLNEKIHKVDIRPIIDIRKVLPKELWSESAAKGVAIPFGKNGIKDVYYCLGVDQHGEEVGAYHSIMGAATGSGKTILEHDIILQGALRYSPKELNFWLLDYKEGVEFAPYKNLPHVTILGMNSEIEFGQEVLQKVIDAIEERGKLFSAAGVAGLPAYNAIVAEEDRLPRVIIIIDEFHALFPKNPKISSKTNALMNDVLRRGRSFGFHLNLSTQTLKDVDMDPQLMPNIKIRIGLSMDKKDISKIFDENNMAVRALSAQGQGIYNADFGQSTANVNFQSYRALDDAVDEILEIINKEASIRYSEEEIQIHEDSRFIYNGETPGSISGNTELEDLFKGVNNTNPTGPLSIYIGEYAGLTKEHALLKFEREYAENLIIAGQNINRIASLMVSFVSQIKRLDPESRIIVNNFNKKSTKAFSRVQDLAGVTVTSNTGHLESIDTLWNLFAERKEASEEALSSMPHVFNIVFLPESSVAFNTSEHSKDSALSRFKKIITEGSELGIHTILYISNISTLSTMDLTRDIDKFKKRIGTGEGSYEKVFGELAADLVKSPSKFVMYALSGEPGVGIFKFKDYGDYNEI